MMTYYPSFQAIADLLAVRLDIDIDKIQPKTKLDSLGADSLTIIELIFDLEDKFELTIGDERPTLIVVQDIADHIDGYLKLKME